MKKEQERDKRFEVMWNELQVVVKGLTAVENRPSLAANSETLSETLPIHRLLLSTR
jgi:hypothetical protein